MKNTSNNLSIDEYINFARNNLHYEFKNIATLIEALTHSSYANENIATGVRDNERLEFLGDAVLETVISEQLFRDPNCYNEGDMTRFRSLTVREESLVEVAKSINLPKYLRFGQGEEKTGGRQKDSNSEDAMEAVIGAIFIDGGWEASKNFIINNFTAIYQLAKSGQLVYDYKSKLYQVLQAEENFPQVEFRLLSETGPAHDRVFTVAVAYKDKLYPAAQANSKKSAEQLAAKFFLENYQQKLPK